MTTTQNEVALIVNGKRYAGWKSIRVTRTIEGLCGSFALDVSDRWRSDTAPWPITEEDSCRVEIDGQAVIEGYIDKRTISGSATERTLSYEGRDRASALVDCSVLVPDSGGKGNKWTYRNINIADFVRAIAKPHGIKVSVQAGLELKMDPLLSAHPGESGFEAIRRATGSSGVIVVSDGEGGVVITRAGTGRAYALVEGVNILSASVDLDATDRFHTYLISSQPPGTDDAYGEATRVQATATDVGVRRTARVLLIRPDKGYSHADARARADWEARIRAAKAATATVTVQGWTQGNGVLWPVNATTHITAPRLLGVDADMLISQAEFSISNEGGQTTQLRLVRPDAFEPEPQEAVVQSSGLWPELSDANLSTRGVVTVPKGISPGK